MTLLLSLCAHIVARSRSSWCGASSRDRVNEATTCRDVFESRIGGSNRVAAPRLSSGGFSRRRNGTTTRHHAARRPTHTLDQSNSRTRSLNSVSTGRYRGALSSATGSCGSARDDRWNDDIVGPRC